MEENFKEKNLKLSEEEQGTLQQQFLDFNQQYWQHLHHGIPPVNPPPQRKSRKKWIVFLVFTIIFFLAGSVTLVAIMGEFLNKSTYLEASDVIEEEIIIASININSPHAFRRSVRFLSIETDGSEMRFETHMIFDSQDMDEIYLIDSLSVGDMVVIKTRIENYGRMYESFRVVQIVALRIGEVDIFTLDEFNQERMNSWRNSFRGLIVPTTIFFIAF
ncbi:MAG: hypothetical protein FWE22_02790 [Firmicutes bacterium]|nr:hypothetical protein [Bacillota bacterium]